MMLILPLLEIGAGGGRVLGCRADGRSQSIVGDLDRSLWTVGIGW